mmetsp:Transcript_12349/g.26291  ORF Transcript_12349/g.26291 Transcript_12349/m.26291 type:complete len:201 (-) Transcript_12349:138-740(-)
MKTEMTGKSQNDCKRKENFRKEKLSHKQNSFERPPLPSKQLRKPRRQNDRFLQTLLRLRQPRHIIPLHIRLLRHHRPAERPPQLLLLSVSVVIVPRSLGFGRRPGSSSASAVGIPAVSIDLGLFIQIVSQFLGSFHVALDSLDDELLARFILLVFQAEGEAGEGVAVEGEGALIVRLVVGGDGFGDQVDGVGDEAVLHFN